MGGKSNQEKELTVHIEFWEEQIEELTRQFLESKGYNPKEVKLANHNGVPVVEAKIYGILDTKEGNREGGEDD